jgi:hypothetical protein
MEMPNGKLHIQFTDLRGSPVNAKVETDFQRFSGGPGAGGEAMEVSLNMGTETDAVISGLLRRGGPATMYKIYTFLPHHRDYTFFQLIMENTVNTASDDVEFWVLSQLED